MVKNDQQTSVPKNYYPTVRWKCFSEETKRSLFVSFMGVFIRFAQWRTCHIKGSFQLSTVSNTIVLRKLGMSSKEQVNWEFDQS